LFFVTNPTSVHGFFRKDSSSTTATTGVATAAAFDVTTTSNISRSVTLIKTVSTVSRNKSTPQLKPNVENVLEQQEKDFEKTQAAKTKTDDHDDHDSPNRPHEDLIFEGEFEYQSDLLPMSTLSSPQELAEFFMDPKNRDLVIKGGGNPCDSIPPSHELYESWKTNAQVVNSVPPNYQNEEILAVHSTVHLVPGLSIEAVSYTGCKVNMDPKSRLPFYEFTLVREDYNGIGRRPMVWMFNKITGKSKPHGTDDNDHPGSSQTFALSRVTIQPDPNENGCRVHYYAHVKVASKLPNNLLRILPLPKRAVEDKVSHSIVAQMEREGVASINKFAKALGEWIEKRHPLQ
jgi:hypothetical protein